MGSRELEDKVQALAELKNFVEIQLEQVTNRFQTYFEDNDNAKKFILGFVQTACNQGNEEKRNSIALHQLSINNTFDGLNRILLSLYVAMTAYLYEIQTSIVDNVVGKEEIAADDDQKIVDLNRLRSKQYSTDLTNYQNVLNKFTMINIFLSQDKQLSDDEKSKLTQFIESLVPNWLMLNELMSRYIGDAQETEQETEYEYDEPRPEPSTNQAFNRPPKPSRYTAIYTKLQAKLSVFATSLKVNPDNFFVMNKGRILASTVIGVSIAGSTSLALNILELLDPKALAIITLIGGGGSGCILGVTNSLWHEIQQKREQNEPDLERKPLRPFY